MSAQVLLSMIAPGPPATSQGSAMGDASAFEGLLAAMASAQPDAVPATVEAIPVEDLDMDPAQAAATVMMAAPPSPPPVVLVTGVPREETEAGTSNAAPSEGEEAALPTSPALSDEMPEATTPIPGDKTAVSKAAPEPLVRPAESVAVPATGKAVVEEPTTPPPVPAPVPSVVKTGAEAPPVQPPAPQPPSLRPLAERTSRPVEASQASDRAGVSDPRVTTAAPVAAPASPSVSAKADAPVQPVDAAPVIGREGAAETPEEPAGAGQTAEAGSTAPAVHVAREAAVPGMSRAAVAATAQIAAQILKRLDGRSTRFEMALTPDELGRVDVKLDIDSEGRLAARLAFDNPAAAADMRGRTDELRRQLEDAGFHVADDAFEFTERDSNSSAFDRGQDARDGQKRAFAAASRLMEPDAAALSPRWTPLSLPPTGVDLKV